MIVNSLNRMPNLSVSMENPERSCHFMAQNFKVRVLIVAYGTI